MAELRAFALLLVLVVAASATADETCDGDGCQQAKVPVGTVVSDEYSKAAQLAHLDRPVDGGTQATVIIVTVSMGYIHFYRNWLIFAQQIGFGEKHIVLTEDHEVYDALYNDANLNLKGRIIDATYKGHTVPNTAHTRSSQSFRIMAARRPRHILKFLKLGYDVIYSDIDTVWLADPLSYFTNPSVSLFIQSDPENDQDDIDRVLCTGYMLVKANDHALDLMTKWEAELMKKPGSVANQDVRRIESRRVIR